QQAFRDNHAEDLAEARHPPGRLLDRPGRAEQSAAVLLSRMEGHGRARAEMERVHGRPRVAREARRDGEERSAGATRREHVPVAHFVLEREVERTVFAATLARTQQARPEKKTGDLVGSPVFYCRHPKRLTSCI